MTNPWQPLVNVTTIACCAMPRRLWYCHAVRHLIAAVVIATAACGGSQPLSTLKLNWQGADSKVDTSPAVRQALSQVPITFGIRDTRPDPTVVGKAADDGVVIHTQDNVAQYCSNRLGDILRSSGARLTEAPAAVLAADLVEYRVDEGNKYAGVVRIRMTIHRNGQPDWSKDYEGTSNKWGRSHSADNYNEALSTSLEEATQNMLTDDDFGKALMGVGVPPMAPSPPPGGPPSAGG